MTRYLKVLSADSALALALGLVATASCSDPTKFNPTVTEVPEEETCAASSEWINGPTPAIAQFRPLPHPDSECPFYRGAVQGFMLAGEPDPRTGEPMVKIFPTIDDVFDPAVALAANQKTAVGLPHGTPTRSWLGDIKQAGQRRILVDQNGHSLYYGIHVNQKFVEFINRYGLRNAEALANAKEDLFFTGGVVEYKSAWQWVKPAMADDSDANDWDSDPDLMNYISTRAWVPTLSQNPDGTFSEDRNHPMRVWVRLLAIHSVYTLPGHPEFIWGSMEHTDFDPSVFESQIANPDIGFPEGDVNAAQAGPMRNVAPLDPRDINPDPDKDPLNLMETMPASGDDHILYKANTPIKDGNHELAETEMTLNGGDQTISPSTSIYRMYPGSKSNTTHPDDAITSLNYNVQTMFDEAKSRGTLNPRDKRMHYRLVGAQWLDKPRYFTLGSQLQNVRANEDPTGAMGLTSPLLLDPAGLDYAGQSAGDAQDAERAAIIEEAKKTGSERTAGVDDIAENGSDSAFAITAGEDRLSSTAMESFTQQPGSFQNCFSCHNTQTINSDGVTCEKGNPNATSLLQPKLINVSHVLSQFLLEECEHAEAAGGALPSFCQTKCNGDAVQ